MKKNHHDHFINQVIDQTRLIMQGRPTLDNITASFNIMIGLLNLCSVRMSKETLIEIVNKFHKGLIDHIEYLVITDDE